MIQLTSELDNGRTAIIKVPETPEDMALFDDWLTENVDHPVAIDTETTGLDIYSPDFRVRTLQVGIGLVAWVINVDHHRVSGREIYEWLYGRDLYLQNAAYDVQAIRQYFGCKLDWHRITDTRILAHLVDSRSKKEGGVGHTLQELTEGYLKLPVVAEDIKGSMTAMAREIGCKKSELFATIDPWNETYLGYAGMDVVLTYGLAKVLPPLVPKKSRPLIKFEHQLAEVCSELSHNGFLLDMEYAKDLSERLDEEQFLWEELAYLEYGVESVNSSADVAYGLIDIEGVTLTEKTPSGAWKLDKSVLEPLAENGSRLAAYVTEAKKAKKWRASWVDKFIDQADENNRCHASINPLLARTGRMSVTGIPAQTLPASDWTIRRCFIADPGQTIVSCDYQAQELRVLAALSGDENMQRAFRTGADLHQLTADASGVDRSVGKTVNFAYVYGSGPRNIAETCGITVDKAREVIRGFEETYPRVKQLSDRLQREAKRNGFIVTPTGRRLFVDKDRPYAALNYMVQSTSRDVTARALLRLHEEGITPYLRLPIHDEVVASVPTEVAGPAAEKIAGIMAMNFLGVHVGTDADVMGPSWGSGYVTDEDREAYEKTLEVSE